MTDETTFQEILRDCVSEKKLSLEELSKKQEKWDRRFMDLAKMIGSWSTCVRGNRKVGSVIVKDKRIISTGYNGAPAGILSCEEKGYCMRNRLNIESGTRAEMCFSAHSEQNALVQAAKLGISVNGATIYVTHRPCAICAKLIINAGIKRIVYAYGYPDEFALKVLEQSGIELLQLPDEVESEEQN